MKELWAPRIYTPFGFVRADVLNGVRALDVGCGGRKLPGAVGMDTLSLAGVDVVHDANNIPWPFEAGTFELVFLNHALEHVGNLVAVMDEIHRVLRPGGRLVVQVPYFRSVDAFNDPTHTHFFTAGSLDYFIEGSGLSNYHYSKKLFLKKGFWFGWPHSPRNPLRRALKSFISACPSWYDQYLSLVLPVECLTWELEALD